MKELTQFLSIKYPIIQAPMLGVTTPDMVAAVADAGGLGSLPVGGLSPERTAALIRVTRAKTNKAFAVNLFAHELKQAGQEDDIRQMEDFLAPIYSKFGLPFERKALADFKFYNHLDQIDILIEEQVPIVSFTFGLLGPEAMDKLKAKGIKVIGTATSVAEALVLEKAGVDVIVAQGIEAGGHRGSFLEEAPLPQVGLISLVPQVVDSVSVPVVAAGGLFDHRTIKAVFALGAQGAQLGTFFIATEESMASEGYKELLRKSADTSSVLTRAFTGKWARGIRNSLMDQIENSGLNLPYYTFQNSLTAALREYGKKSNTTALTALWSGQSGSKTRKGSTEKLFLDLIEQLQKEPNPVFWQRSLS